MVRWDKAVALHDSEAQHSYFSLYIQKLLEVRNMLNTQNTIRMVPPGLYGGVPPVVGFTVSTAFFEETF